MLTSPRLVVGLNAVIIALAGDEPRVLTVSVPEGTPLEGGTAALEKADGPGVVALPTGPLDPAGDRTLELALRRWVKAWSGLDLGYVEQLYTFGDRYRDPAEGEGGPRVVSVASIGLTHQKDPEGASVARWRSIYPFLPWEDGRNGRPRLIEQSIEPELARWIDRGGKDRGLRRERASLAFAFGDSPWDGERVLERYEILFEIGLVSEGCREDRDEPGERISSGPGLGLDMAFDHRRILATALGRIRAKIRYRPVIFELMPETFTLLQLQRAVEALSGVRLHKQNFRRLVETGGLVEGTGRVEPKTGGRPAELFRFRREVLLERPATGVGLPGH
ncbi:MAG: hypothetical protein ABFS37_10685 [Acidobacteriota bacterium]